MPIIIPESGEDAGQLAQELLGLAGHRDEVSWQVGADLFEVSDAVAKAYLAQLNNDAAQDEAPQAETKAAPPPAARRTRGPNKKNGK